METQNKYDLSDTLTKINHMHTAWALLNEVKKNYNFLLNDNRKNDLDKILIHIILKEDEAKKELLEQIKVNGKNFIL